MVNKKPLISAIIIAYKSERFLEQCIKSLLQSAMYAKMQIEIIVVVNDKDNKNYIFPKNIKLINASYNLGYAKGLSEGAKIAKGEWLLILNPDTLTQEETLKYLTAHFNSQSIAVVAPLIQYSNKKIQLSLNGEPTLWSQFLEQSYLYKLLPFIFRNTMANKDLYTHTQIVKSAEATYLAVRHTIFKKTGGFDERFFMYFEDMDLCKRIINKGYKIIFEPRAKIIHLGHKSSNGIMLGDIYIRSLYKFLSIYHSKYYSILCVLLVAIGCLLRLIYWNLKIRITKREEALDFGRRKITYCAQIIIFLFQNFFKYYSIRSKRPRSSQ